MNVAEALRHGRQALAGVSETGPSDARLLLADTMQRPTTWILAHPEDPLPAGEAEAFLSRLTRCASGEPLPYVLGWWEFYGRKFIVGPGVLIPRPETEILVEIALDAVRRRRTRPRLIDVGTGTGCVAISLAAETDGLQIVASDLSPKALAVASANAIAHRVEGRLGFVRADLLAGLRGPWDVVCANLPYIDSLRARGLRVVRHEPVVALDGGPQGTGLAARLLRQLSIALAPGGTAILEMDHGQGALLMEIARESLPAARARVARDLAGFDRFLVLEG